MRIPDISTPLVRGCRTLILLNVWTFFRHFHPLLLHLSPLSLTCVSFYLLAALLAPPLFSLFFFSCLTPPFFTSAPHLSSPTHPSLDFTRKLVFLHISSADLALFYSLKSPAASAATSKHILYLHFILFSACLHITPHLSILSSNCLPCATLCATPHHACHSHSALARRSADFFSPCVTPLSLAVVALLPRNSLTVTHDRLVQDGDEHSDLRAELSEGTESTQGETMRRDAE